MRRETGKEAREELWKRRSQRSRKSWSSLKSRISELEESLRVERLRNRLNEKIIDIAEARWHIEIRKKADTKR